MTCVCPVNTGRDCCWHSASPIIVFFARSVATDVSQFVTAALVLSGFGELPRAFACPDPYLPRSDMIGANFALPTVPP